MHYIKRITLECKKGMIKKHKQQEENEMRLYLQDYIIIPFISKKKITDIHLLFGSRILNYDLASIWELNHRLCHSNIRAIFVGFIFHRILRTKEMFLLVFFLAQKN